MSALPERVALFPGTFDPITFGHIEIVNRALQLFDRVVVGVGVNTQKANMFSPEQRCDWIKESFANQDRVRIEIFTKLTVQFAHDVGANFLLRGLRDAFDFQYEKNINFLNKHLDKSIETVFLVSDADTQTVSSTLVREIIRFGGDLSGLVPGHIIRSIADSLHTPAE